MALPAEHVRDQLVSRREQLQAAIGNVGEDAQLVRLLREVDAALEQAQKGTFGLCDVCHEPIEPDRLRADPLIRTCLDHLSVPERRALEQDLELAVRVQRELLPPRRLVAGGWDIAYHYEPARTVSGDYCDLLGRENPDGPWIVLLGDISGKGVAASMLMAHLHASFRALSGLSLPMDQVLSRVNRVFCDSTMSSHYATLVSTRLDAAGRVEVSNAGHCPPLLIRGDQVTSIPSNGLPVGMFCTGAYPATNACLEPGDTLLLYTDGVTETFSEDDELYGEDRLTSVAVSRRALEPPALIHECLHDLAAFRGRAPRTDDVTLTVIRRTG